MNGIALHLMMVGIGACSILYGLLCLFRRDIVWSLWQASFFFQGIEAEPTDAWHIQQALGGMLFIVAGGLLLYTTYEMLFFPREIFVPATPTFRSLTPTPVTP
jgi:hypothetical protein